MHASLDAPLLVGMGGSMETMLAHGGRSMRTNLAMPLPLLPKALKIDKVDAFIGHEREIGQFLPNEF